MRTYRLFPLLAVVLLSSACTKEYITKEYITEETSYYGTELTFVDITVNSNEWRDQGGYFRAEKKVDAITKDVFESGQVQVSAYMVDSNGVVTWTPLPMMRVDKVADEDFYYTTYTDYEWNVGYVYIYVTTSDLYTGDNPGTCSFRVFITTNP